MRVDAKFRTTDSVVTLAVLLAYAVSESLSVSVSNSKPIRGPANVAALKSEEIDSSQDGQTELSLIDKLERQTYLRPRAHGTPQASDRLMKELTDIYKSDSYKQNIIRVDLVDDNLYEWEVQLNICDPDSPLHVDLLHMWEMGRDNHIKLRVTYGDNYPNEPPFVRIVYPVMVYPGSYVQPGGALCMQLLTSQGWNRDCTSEAMFLSIAALLIEGKSRVDFDMSFDDNVNELYNAERAKEAFEVAARYHKDNGW